MRTLSMLAVVMLLCGAAQAQSEQQRYESPAKRFCFVVSDEIIGSLYDQSGAQPRLLWQTTVEPWATILVADSGAVVATHMREEGRLATLYRPGGTVLATLSVHDVFSARDVALMHGQFGGMRYRIEEDVLVIEVPTDARAVTVAVSLQDGYPLEPVRDRYPTWGVYAAPAAATEPKYFPRSCSNHFTDAARIASKQLFARAVERVIPPYPELARKAKISGGVWVDVVVSESGKVICTRASSMPFGVAEAAENAARAWTFTPYEIDGRPVAVAGELVFHFVRLTPDEWAEIESGVNPTP